MDAGVKYKSAVQRRFEAKGASFHAGPNSIITDPSFIKMGRAEWMAYEILKSWQDRDTGDARHSKCEQEMSEIMRLDVRSIRRALSRLEKARWITKTRNGRMRIRHVEEMTPQYPVEWDLVKADTGHPETPNDVE